MANALQEIDRRLADPLAPLRGRADAVGLIGADIPIDVLLASGRPFGHLPWDAAAPTPWADQWLESSFPYWARSILELWHAGAFDGMGTVVFSRAEDASQRLYYYVRELQRRGALRGPAVAMFDVALLPRESSLAHTTAAIAEIATALDTPVADLARGIESANRLRGALQQLQAGRSAHGPFYERVARAALWNDPTPWLEHVEAPRASPPTARVLLAGSAPPDDRLHRAAEDAGASIVAEAHVHGLARLGGPLALAGDSPERAIARRLTATSVGPRAVRDRAQWIVQQASAARARGVILWLTREDEALAWHVPAQRRALEAAGIPALVLPAAHWRADDGALDRITSFCQGLRNAPA
jgi:hypothetical protein